MDDPRVALDGRTRLWSGGRILAGGAPWRVVRLGVAAVPFVSELRRAAAAGAVPGTPSDRSVARLLLERGLAYPVRSPRPGPHPVTVVVPAYDRVAQLEVCLAALKGLDVIVVDDASVDHDAIRRVAARHGARLIRHEVNRGPAAARNTGAHAATSDLIAFVDSDCAPRPGWLDILVPHFDDSHVGAIAPRVVPRPGGGAVMARHEATRSALDMGTLPEQVRPGARLGFLPGATLLVRREVIQRFAFDEQFRLGEDVDFVWRVTAGGWHVRYEPRAVVEHEPVVRLTPWVRRRFQYGTSAAALAQRHHGRLVPARLSAWNLATLALLAERRPFAAAAVSGAAATMLARRLAREDVRADVALRIVGQGMVADAAALGHLLRREWWPIGALAIAACTRSRIARAAATCMIGPIALEWLRQRPAVDPLRYAALRLIEDAAYGSGVIVSAVSSGVAEPLVPAVRVPRP
jgi:mycofactocin system glycosyltransferase